MKPFGRGGGRCPPDRRRENRNQNSPLRIKTEKLTNAGHLISPESKNWSNEFTLKQVINILKDQSNSTVYQDDQLRALLKTWRQYKSKNTLDIPKMPYATVVTELQTIQKQLIAQDNDHTIDEVMEILRNQHEKSLVEFKT